MASIKIHSKERGTIEIKPVNVRPAGTISITENGTHDVTNYASANVNVQGGSTPVLKTLSVNENGTYTPPAGVDGYNVVNVNVDTERHVMINRDFTLKIPYLQTIGTTEMVNVAIREFLYSYVYNIMIVYGDEPILAECVSTDGAELIFTSFSSATDETTSLLDFYKAVDYWSIYEKETFGYLYIRLCFYNLNQLILEEQGYPDIDINYYMLFGGESPFDLQNVDERYRQYITIQDTYEL